MGFDKRNQICSVPECDRDLGEDGHCGMCALHYRRLRRTGKVGPAVPLTAFGHMAAECSVDECSSPPRSRGMCSKHYTRWRIHGDPLFTQVIVGDDERRFWSKVDRHVPNGCWPWTDTPDEDGYGYFRVGRKSYRAARYSWILANGQISDGLVIDHLCRNRICVNPKHLDPVTNRVNVVIRGLTPTALNLRKTHCINGHEFTPANTYVSPAGSRHCRECQRNRDRRRRQALAA